MSDDSSQTSDSSSQVSESSSTDADLGRRSFLSSSATVFMAGGLAGGYGTFFAMAGQFFYPSEQDKHWVFVSDADSIAAGDSLPFQSSNGVAVMITRRVDGSETEENPERSLTVDSFLALSSICPHLGCRVHWESNNNRFFCPCHNGIFDAEGIATGGPPAAEGQNLPHYALQIVDGALYIEMPISSIGRKS